MYLWNYYTDFDKILHYATKFSFDSYQSNMTTTSQEVRIKLYNFYQKYLIMQKMFVT
jgi:hypothetical protein